MEVETVNKVLFRRQLFIDWKVLYLIYDYYCKGKNENGFYCRNGLTHFLLINTRFNSPYFVQIYALHLVKLT